MKSVYSSGSEFNDTSSTSELNINDENISENELDKQLEELSDNDSEDITSFMNIDELVDYVGNFLDETIDGVVPYKYLPTSQRKYEPLLGFKPIELKGRLDNESNEENSKLFKYRKSAVHQVYKKVRNETKKFVSIIIVTFELIIVIIIQVGRNFKKLAVADTPRKMSQLCMRKQLILLPTKTQRYSIFVVMLSTTVMNSTLFYAGYYKI